MWKQLIQHLASKGLSQYAMAKATGVDQSTISRLAAGQTEPRYSVGAALIELGGGLDELRTCGVEIAAPQPDSVHQPVEQGVANV